MTDARAFAAVLAIVAVLAGIAIIARLHSLLIGFALPASCFAFGTLLFEALRRKAESKLASLPPRVEPQGPRAAP